MIITYGAISELAHSKALRYTDFLMLVIKGVHRIGLEVPNPIIGKF